MSMVIMSLHNPPIPLIPMLLVWRMSRTMIMRVRRTLSESAIEAYGRVAHSLPFTCADWYTTTILIAMLSGLAQSTAAGL